MDARRANEKMLARKQPHSKLINTFGDNQTCWAFPSDLLDFEEGLKEHAQQTTKHKVGFRALFQQYEVLKGATLMNILHHC